MKLMCPERWRRKARESEIMDDLEDYFLETRIVGGVQPVWLRS